MPLKNPGGGQQRVAVGGWVGERGSHPTSLDSPGGGRKGGQLPDETGLPAGHRQGRMGGHYRGAGHRGACGSLRGSGDTVARF